MHDASRGESPDALSERSGRIVAAHKLLRRARRAGAGEFLADGAQSVREAVAAERERPGTVRQLFVTAAAASRNVEIVRAALSLGISVSEVADRAAAKLSDALTPQGITALCTLPAAFRSPPPAAGRANEQQAARDCDQALSDVLAGSPRLLAVMVETSDPGNAGTIIRLADAAGADAVIVAGESVDPFGPKAVRASVGSIFHLPVVPASSTAALLHLLAEAGIASLATTGRAGVDLGRIDGSGQLERPTAWLFGNEAHGLPESVIDAADHAVRIPIYGKAESLNLAAAAAICLYASAAAQRRGEPG